MKRPHPAQLEEGPSNKQRKGKQVQPIEKEPPEEAPETATAQRRRATTAGEVPELLAKKLHEAPNKNQKQAAEEETAEQDQQKNQKKAKEEETAEQYLVPSGGAAPKRRWKGNQVEPPEQKTPEEVPVAKRNQPPAKKLHDAKKPVDEERPAKKGKQQLKKAEEEEVEQPPAEKPQEAPADARNQQTQAVENVEELSKKGKKSQKKAEEEATAEQDQPSVEKPPDAKKPVDECKPAKKGKQKPKKAEAEDVEEVEQPPAEKPQEAPAKKQKTHGDDSPILAPDVWEGDIREGGLTFLLDAAEEPGKKGKTSQTNAEKEKVEKLLTSGEAWELQGLQQHRKGASSDTVAQALAAAGFGSPDSPEGSPALFGLFSAAAAGISSRRLFVMPFFRLWFMLKYKCLDCLRAHGPTCYKCCIVFSIVKSCRYVRNLYLVSE